VEPADAPKGKQARLPYLTNFKSDGNLHDVAFGLLTFWKSKSLIMDPRFSLPRFFPFHAFLRPQIEPQVPF
jgi:hypothetical protein